MALRYSHQEAGSKTVGGPGVARTVSDVARCMKRVLLVVPVVGLVIGAAYLGRWLTVAYSTVEAATSSDTVRLQFDRHFIEQHKDRVTMHATFIVDQAMSRHLGAVH